MGNAIRKLIVAPCVVAVCGLLGMHFAAAQDKKEKAAAAQDKDKKDKASTTSDKDKKEKAAAPATFEMYKDIGANTALDSTTARATY